MLVGASFVALDGARLEAVVTSKIRRINALAHTGPCACLFDTVAAVLPVGIMEIYFNCVVCRHDAVTVLVFPIAILVSRAKNWVQCAIRKQVAARKFAKVGFELAFGVTAGVNLTGDGAKRGRGRGGLRGGVGGWIRSWVLGWR